MVILLLVKKARAERSLAFSPALCFQAWEKDEAAPHPLPLCAPLTASESENHGVTECFGVEGTFRGHLAQPPCSKQGYFQLALNVSRDGASTTSLGNLCQCFTTLMLKNSSLYPV